LLGLDGFEQRLEIRARRNYVELLIGLEQPAEPLAYEVFVFCEHDADRHSTSI